jgi:hypothetical protein
VRLDGYSHSDDYRLARRAAKAVDKSEGGVPFLLISSRLLLIRFVDAVLADSICALRKAGPSSRLSQEICHSEQSE